MLTQDEEFMLAKSWRERGDVDSAHKLVTSHLRLVAKIAMGYRGYGLPLSELISEGNVGMMQAVKRFDPDRGFRLATYAMWWIRASIQEYILHSWSLVKMGTTSAQKKLFFNLRKMKGKLKAFEEGDLSPENVTKIATELAVTENDVVQMNPPLGRARPFAECAASRRQRGRVAGLAGGRECARPGTVGGRPGGARPAARHAERGMKVLNKRELHILTERRLREDPLTLEELSQQYGISRERVRQIEVRAFEKLQKAMKTW